MRARNKAIPAVAAMLGLTAVAFSGAASAESAGPELMVFANKGPASKAASVSETASKSPKTARYGNLIEKHARANGVPVRLAHAVVRIESNFNARARGQAGEVGLMQIKPASARAMGYSGGAAGLYNPETNLRFGMKYLGIAHGKANGDVCGTIMRYNGGHYATRMTAVSRGYCRKVMAML